MYEYKALVTRVVDGDTLNVTIDCGFGIGYNTILRLTGINAPEMKTPEGIVARDYALGIISSLGSTITINTTKDKKEKYGRYLAKVVLSDGSILNALMVASGNAKPYMV